MTLPTTANVRFSAGGVAMVEASLNVSRDTRIQCCTYPADPPILAVTDHHVSVSITVPDRHKVTPDDLDTAQRLADAVAQYIAELHARMAAQDNDAAEGVAA
jgi:hypothetical protein